MKKTKNIFHKIAAACIFFSLKSTEKTVKMSPVVVEKSWVSYRKKWRKTFEVSQRKKTENEYRGQTVTSPKII